MQFEIVEVNYSHFCSKLWLSQLKFRVQSSEIKCNERHVWHVRSILRIYNFIWSQVRCVFGIIRTLGTHIVEYSHNTAECHLNDYMYLKYYTV